MPLVISNQKRINANLTDGSGTIQLVWFQGAAWLEKSLIPGEEYLIYGKANRSGYAFSMAHPEMELVKDIKRLPGLEPVYNSTEKLNAKGLDSRMRRKSIAGLFEKLPANAFPETLPAYIIQRFKSLRCPYWSIGRLHSSERNRLESSTSSFN